METTPPRRVLMLAYEFPPSAGGGVQRLVKFARYLPEAGWEPTVIAAEPVAGRPRDDSLVDQVRDVPVVRLPARHVSSAIARVTGALRGLRPRASRTDSAAPRDAGSPSSRRTAPWSVRLARWVSVDDAAPWSRTAVRRALAMHREQPFDVVLASGPPYSAMIAAVNIAEACGIPAVVDLRDPWRDNAAVPRPTRWHRRRAEALERDVMRRAAAVVVVSPSIADEASSMGAIAPLVLPNGFDSADVPAWRPRAAQGLTLVFLGSLYRGVADPAPLFAALAEARRSEPSLDIRLDIVGPDPEWARDAAASAGVGDVVRFLGFRPHAEALSLVAEADAGVVLIADAPGTEAVYTGKLFEYLGIGVPVLLLGPEAGAAAEVVREARAGLVVSSSDPEAAVAALLELATLKRDARPVSSPDPVVVARFERRAQSHVLAGVLDAVSRRD